MRTLAKYAAAIGAAALSAALCSHFMLHLAAASHIGSPVFDGHAHGSIAPSMAIVAVLFVLLSGAFVFDARAGSRESVLREATRLDGGRVVALAAIVGSLGAATLFAMEFSESGAAAFGFAWLGGNAAVGVLALAVSAICTTAAIKIASDARGIALERLIGLLSKVIRPIAARTLRENAVWPRREPAYVRAAALRAKRSTGLRAPPRSTF